MIHNSSRIRALAAFSTFLILAPAWAWNTLPARIDENPSFHYTPSPADWRTVSMYQIMTDRFNDGNPGNNSANGTYDPTQGNKIHGGDFAGIRQQLGYLQDLGVSAIWISPVQFSVDAYHAYAPTDFNRIESHFGSLQELRDLIDDAHSRGIYVILDIVVNHMADRVGSFDAGFPAFNGNGYSMQWWNSANQHAEPFNQVGRFHNYGEINNWDDSWQVIHGEFKPGGLDDIKTEDSGVREDLKRIFKALIDATDCDGFRIDAVKHIEDGFWETFIPAIYSHAASRGKSNFLVFGESLDGNDDTLSSWTWSPRGFNSMLYFPMHYKMLDVFAYSQATKLLTDRIDVLSKYQEKSRYQLVNFLDCHDTSRIMYDTRMNGDIWRLRPALTFLYTSLQIPCLYYGTEQGFNGGSSESPPKDIYYREDMFDGEWEWGPSLGNNFNTNHEIYVFIRKLNQLRRAYPALTQGTFQQLWQTTDGAGIYAYSKQLGSDEVIVVLNTHFENRTCTPAAARPNGTVYENLLNPAETFTVSGGKLSVTMLGHDQKILAARSAPLWLGNTRTYPGPTHHTCPGDDCNPTLEPGETLWIDTETAPIAPGQSVQAFFRTSPGAAWTSTNVDWYYNGTSNSGWHVSLGAFPAGTTVQFYLRAQDADETAVDNNGGAYYSIGVTAPGTPSSASFSPAAPDGCTDVTVTYSPNDGPLSNAAPVYLHLGRNNWQDLLAPDPAMTYVPASRAWTYTYAVPRGTTQINCSFHNGAGTADNNGSSNWNVSVANCPAVSGIEITVPATDVTVGNGTTSYTLGGLSDGTLTGHFRWTNTLTGDSGRIAAGTTWSLPSLALAAGANVITITGTNAASGMATNAADDAGQPAYTNGWQTGDNGGSGWGAWSLTNYGAQAGCFIAADESNLDIGPQAWGLWANSSNTAEIARPFGAALATGQVFRLQFDNNWIEKGFSVGIALQNTARDNLFEFMFIGGATNYIVNDNILTRDTRIPWSSNGWDMVFELTSSNQYRFTCGTNIITGTLKNGTDPAITRFRAWNYSAGPGFERNLYLNRLRVTRGSGAAVLRSDTVTITREAGAADSDGDGIDDQWEREHFDNDLNAANASSDWDKDGLTDRQESFCGTDPKSDASCLRLVSGPPPAGGARLLVQWSSAAGKRYTVLRATNLLGEARWQTVGTGVTATPPANTYTDQVNSAGSFFYKIRKD